MRHAENFSKRQHLTSALSDILRQTLKGKQKARLGQLRFYCCSAQFSDGAKHITQKLNVVLTKAHFSATMQYD